MSTVIELLGQLNQIGAEVSIFGDELRIVAPKNTVTPDLISALKANKPDMMRALSMPMNTTKRNWKVWRVVVDGNGMKIFDTTGGSFEEFYKETQQRFGAHRVQLVEPYQ